MTLWHWSVNKASNNPNIATTSPVGRPFSWLSGLKTEYAITLDEARRGQGKGILEKTWNRCWALPQYPAPDSDFVTQACY